MIRPKEFLKEIVEEGMPEDLHITRNCSSFVAVSNGKVIKVSDPYMEYCPLANMLGLEGQRDKELMKRNIIGYMERKIDEFGFFTEKRVLDVEGIAIPYGASEMMMYDLAGKKGGTDAAVVVCDGAGTVITPNPYLVQDIGARMNGLFYTSPIDKVIRGIEQRGGRVPFPGEIDQIRGLQKAVDYGYENIDITVGGLGDEDLSKIRRIEKREGVSVTILSVCNTGIDEKRTGEIERYGDLVWSCACRGIRESTGKKAKIQVATRIPVFGLTEKALDVVKNYSEGLEEYVREREGPYIISGKCKRLNGVSNCKRIKIGDFESYIGVADSLPIRDEDEPRPLF